jgi:hypothetical protein
MPALLALVPLKDWIYAGIIATLLVGFGVYTVHERHEGAHKIEIADAKVAAAQTIHNEEVQSVIQAKVQSAINDYDALAPIPSPVPVPRLVCRPAGSGNVPQGTQSASGGDGAGGGVPVSSSADSFGFDPAPALSATGTDADAEIEHLQKKVKLLQDLVHAYQDGGLVAK